MSTHPHIPRVISVIGTEIKALSRLSHILLDNKLLADYIEQFILFLGTEKKLYFTGIGKSGHVARLLAASYASLGVSSFYLDPLDCVHGDSGTLRSGDRLVIISKSCSGSELLQLALLARNKHILLDVWAGRAGELMGHVDHTVLLPDVHEADEHDIIPTSSILVFLSFGHGVLLAHAESSGFSIGDFTASHPGGKLGMSLADKDNHDEKIKIREDR